MASGRRNWQHHGDVMTISNAINNIQFTSVNIVTFTSNGTYTPPSNLLWCQVECMGGGGGSAGCVAPGSNQVAGGSNGASGSYTKKVYDRSALTPSVTVTIGGGGAGGAAGANNGVAGGNTTFLGMTANGGGGGLTSAAGATSAAAGGTANAPSGGDVNITGNSGYLYNAVFSGGFVFPMLVASTTPSILGGSNQGAPLAGVLYGGGASGANRWNPGNTGSQAGAAGAAGIVIVTEFLAS